MKKVNLLFPGQGVQCLGMGRVLYDNFSVVSDIFDEASSVLGVDFNELCFHTEDSILSETDNAQLAIFITEYSSYRLLSYLGLEVEIMLGHSLGEITALTAANSISFLDALRIVELRGKIMKKVAKYKNGAMYSVRNLELSELDQIIRRYENIFISNINSPNQIVVSGEYSEMKKSKEKIEESKGSVTWLKVKAPFHTPLMAEASELFYEEIEKFKFRMPEIKIISNTTADFYQETTDIKELLKVHINTAVKWDQSIDLAKTNNLPFLDIGPGNIFKKMLKDKGTIYSFSDYYQGKMISTDETKFWGDFFVSHLETVEIKKEKKELIEKIVKNENQEKNICLIDKCLSISSTTKNNNSENNHDFNQIVIQAKERKFQILKEKRAATNSEAVEFVNFIFTVMDYKKIGNIEKSQRINEIAIILVEEGIDWIL